jgi:hypothetical protein
MDLHTKDGSEDSEDWYAMREAAQSSTAVFRSLLEKYKTTSSPFIAGWLIGVVTACRRQGSVPPEETVAALLELTKSMKVWEMNQTPTGLLHALFCATYEDGLPDGADYEALADFIHQASFENYSTFKGPAYHLDIEVIHVCSSLAGRGQLLAVLATRPGARDEMILRIESSLRSLAENDKHLYESYGEEARFVIDSLRRNIGDNSGH